MQASASIAGVLRSLGYKPSGGMHRYITGHSSALGLDTAHFTGSSWNRGRTGFIGPGLPLAEILVANSTYPSAKVRRRLVEAGLPTNAVTIERVQPV